MNRIELLQQQIVSCRICQDAGLIERAAPVVSGRLDDRMMLIGQAPGITELAIRRPFAGRAGKELFRWMRSIGIEEDEFRAHVYISATTKCFPGRQPGGAGDRRPSPREVALCRRWLDAEMDLVRPETILLVGGLAIERYFPKVALSDLIGRRFQRDGVTLIPLPHPSGASRWLNASDHKALLAVALEHVRSEWSRIMLSPAGSV